MKKNINLSRLCYGTGVFLLIWIARRLYFQGHTPIRRISDHLHGHIPNQVHFVWLLPDPQGDIELELRHFLSIYSALLWFQPDIIYIHTDASVESIDRARHREDDSNHWTRTIFNLPRLEIRRVQAPTHAEISGVEIKNLENKADFVKVQAMYELGGIYLDWDMQVLRDVKSLRESGFTNVMGTEMGGGVIAGAWLSRKRSHVNQLWMANQHIVYDGEWTTHANVLITKISKRLSSMSKEVLILDRNAFVGPTSWTEKDIHALWAPYLDNPAPSNEQTYPGPRHDADYLWKESVPVKAGEMDFSACYMIHAYSVNGHGALYLPDNFTGVTLDYLLEQRSNSARAVYPTLQHAIKAGLVLVD